MGNKSASFQKRFVSKIVNFNGLVTEYPSIATINKVRIGADDPHWKSKVKRGQNATNYLSASSNSQDYYPGEAMAKAVAGGYLGKTCYTSTGSPKPVNAPSVVNASKLQNANISAATNILKKIQSETQSFSGTTFLGELREGIHMLRHPAEALAGELNRHAKRLSKRRPKFWYDKRQDRIRERKLKPLSKSEKSELKSFSQLVANSWLEAVFGWAPLLSDIQGIAESSFNKFNEPVIKRLTGYGEESTTLVMHKERTAGIASIYYQYIDDQTSTRQVIYTVGYRRKLDSSSNGFQRVIANSGLGSWRDAVPAAWELLPWSFLIDYFSNIGDVINAACVSTTDVAWCRRTTIEYHRRTYQGVTHRFKSPTYVALVNSAGVARTKKRTVERVAASLPIPGLRFELPESNIKLANIAALLTGFL
jgi:hypothetical protein